MTRRLLPAVLLVMFCAAGLSLRANPISSTATGGNWSLPTTWVGGLVPSAADDVTIARGATVAVTDSRAANSVTFQAAAGAPAILDIGNAGDLTISTSLTIPADSTYASTALLSASSSQLTVNGDVVFNGPLAPASAQLTFSSSGTLQVGGSFQNDFDGTFNAGSGTVIFNGIGAQTGGDFTYNNLTVNKPAAVGATFNNVAVSGSLSLLGGDFDITSGTASVNNASLAAGTKVTGFFGVLTMNGSSGALSGAGSALIDVNTVFDGNYNVSGALTFGNSVSVNLSRSLTVATGAGLAFNGSLTVDGSVLNNGTVTSTYGDGSGIYGQGTWTQGNSSVLNVTETPMPSPGTFLADATGNRVEYNGPFGSVRGGGTSPAVSTIYYDLKINPGVETQSYLNGDISVLHDLDVATGTFYDGGYAIDGSAGHLLILQPGAGLKVLAPTLATFAAGDSFAATSKVEYGSDSDQTVRSATYGNLTLSCNCVQAFATLPGSRRLLTGHAFIGPQKTLGGAVSVLGQLDVSQAPLATLNATLVTAGKTITVSGDVVGNGAIDMSGGGSLTLQGSFMGSGPFAAGTGTVIYAGSAAALVRSNITYSNLTIGGGIKSLDSGLSPPSTAVVSGTTTLSPGSEFALGANTVQAGGDVSLLGVVSGTGTFILDGPPAILSGGGPGTDIVAPLRFETSKSIVGTVGNFGFGTTVIGPGAVVTNSGTVKLYSLNGTDAASKWVNAAGSTLFHLADNMLTTGILDASAPNNTVAYNNNGPNNIKPTTYANLWLLTAGNRQFSPGTVINGNLLISANGLTAAFVEPMVIGGSVQMNVGSPTNTLTLGAFTHVVKGDWSTSGNLVATGSTVQFNGTVAQAVSNVATGPFNHVVFSSSGPKSLGTGTGTFAAAGNVTIDPGASVAAGSFGHTVGGNWTVNGTFQPGLSSINFNGAGTQTISATPLHDVQFSGGTKVLAGATSSTSWTINSGATVSAGSFNHTIAGSFLRLGGAVFNAGTSTMEFTGGASISINDASFNILKINMSGGSATLAGANSASTLNVAAGTLDLGSGLTLSGDMTVNGTVLPGTGTLLLNGSSPQTLGGSANPINVNNLNFSNSTAALSVNQNVQVAGTLTLNGADINVAPSFVLGFGTAGTISRVTNTFVNGSMTKQFAGPSTFKFELGAAGYAPVTVGVLTGSGTFRVTPASVVQPNRTGTNTLSRYWTVVPGLVTSANLTFEYPGTDTMSGTPSNYVGGRFNGSGWLRANPLSPPSPPPGAATFSSIGSLAGDWTLGEPLSLGAAVNLLIAAAGSQTAGTANNLTLTAKDSAGNPDISYAGDHALTFSGAGSSPGPVTAPTVSDKVGTAVAFGSPTTLTFTNGTATVSGALNGVMRLYKTEAAAVAVTDGSLTSLSPLPVAVSPAPASGFALGGPASLTAGSTTPISLTAKDPYGNTDSAYTGSRSVIFGGASASTNPITPPTVDGATFGAPVSINFAGGTASGTLALYKAENANVSASAAPVTTLAPLAVAVSEGPLNKFRFSLSSPQINGLAFTGTNTLTAEDAFGNAITSFNSSSDSVTIAANPPLSGTSNSSTSFAGGTANLTGVLTYTGTVGSGTFTASSASGKSGTSGPVTINAGPPSQMVFLGVNGGINPVQTNPFFVDIESRDASGNPANVSAPTPLALSVATGSGTLGGTTTGVIAAGTHNATISGITYSAAESGVVLHAAATGGDPVGGVNSAAFTVGPNNADLSVSGSAPSSVALGSNLTYTFIITNNGPFVANAATFTDTLPPALAFVSATTTAGSCSGNPTVTCNFGALPNAATATVTITVTATTAGSVSNSGAVVTSSADPNSANNSFSVTVAVTSSLLTVSSNADSGPGTLRQALIDVNNGICPATCTIRFNLTNPLPVTFFLTSELPPITAPVIIDGTSQPGYAGTPVINLDGSALPAGSGGLDVQAPGCVIRGLQVRGFSGYGIGLEGGGGTTVENCFIGRAGGPNGKGLLIASAGNTIGGVLAAQRNVIGSNTGSGIELTSGVLPLRGPAISALQPAPFAASGGNTISGNYIGVAADGITPAGNSSYGILITGSSPGNNISDNVIAFNGAAGVGIQNPSSANAILSNSIHDNAGLGIDLGADGIANTNDPGDGDSGANGMQNAPVLATASLVGSALSVRFTVDSSSVVSTGSLLVQFFKADSSGEGQTYLASNCFAGSLLNNITYSMPAGPVVPGDPVVATATSYQGGTCGTANDGTSEFAVSAAAATCTPPPATITTAPIVCASSPGNAASVPATSGATYSWSLVNGTITSGQGTNAITYTAGASGTANLSVSVTDPIGCSNSGSASVAISAPPAPVITGPTATCSGQSVTLDAGPGFSSYVWSTGATSQFITVTPTTSTVYSVTVTNAAGCSGSASQTVTVNSNPSVTITAPASVCTGGSGTASVPVQGGATYNWSVTGGTISGGLGTDTITFAPSGSGPITLSVSVTVGSCTSTGSASVAVSPTTVVSIAGPGATCAGQSVTLDAGPGYSTYSWSTGANTQAITVAPTATTTYGVTVTSAGGCTGSGSKTVTVSSNPTTTITAPASVCVGSSGTASVPVQSGATYNWTITGGSITNGIGTDTVAFTPSGAGPITLNASVTVGACTSSGSATVAVQPAAVVTITGPTATCSGQSVTLDAGPGFSSYSWSTGATSQTITVAPTASTTYNVSVTTAAGCSGSSSKTVTVTSNPIATITAPPSVCTGGSATASVPLQGGATYNWTITGGAINSGVGTDTIGFSPSGSGPVIVAVSVTNGSCTSSSSKSVAVSPTATVVIAGPTSVCAGGSVQLDAGPGHATYLWSTGATTRSIIVRPVQTTTYIVDVTDAGGCSGSGSTTVVVSPTPVISISAPASVSPGSAGNTATASSTGATSYSWSITNGTITSGQTAATVTFTAGASGQVSLSVTVAGSVCSNTQSRAVPIDASACATAPPSLLGPPEGASLSSPLTFSWSGVSGGISYDLLISPQSGAPITVSTSANSLTLDLPAGAVTWRVVAHLASTCSPSTLSSASRSFTVTEGSSCTSNIAPVPLSPANNDSLASPITFIWRAAGPNVTGYRVSIIQSGVLQELGTTTGTRLVSTLPPGPAVWFVEALYNSCPPVASAHIDFAILDANCANHDKPGLIAPANEVTVSLPPTLQWTAISGADGYRPWISVDGGVANALATTTSTSLSATIDPGAVSWFVEALFNGCPSTYSDTSRFTIAPSANCATAPPLPFNPPASAQLTDPRALLSWSAAPGAVAYEVYLAFSNGTPTLIGTTAATSLSFDLAQPGQYLWFVSAKFNGCSSEASQRRGFTYVKADDCTNLRPHALAPLEPLVTEPADFAWTAVPDTVRYEVTIQQGASSRVLTTTATRLTGVSLSSGPATWSVRAILDGDCPPAASTSASFIVVPPPPACTVPPRPSLSAPAQVSSGVTYTVRWGRTPRTASYVLQEATQPTFANAVTVANSGTDASITHSNSTGNPIAYYYRVQAVGDCTSQSLSSTSEVATVLVLPGAGQSIDGSRDLGAGSTIVFGMTIGAEHGGEQFTATPTRPWLTVNPASGVVPGGGTTLVVTANTADLPIGTSLGGVTLTFATATAGGNRVGHGGGSTIVPVSISIVSPVSSTPKSGPPPDALIIPAVAHADGLNSKFESDVRVTNTSPQVMKYQVNFTPTGGSGISSGRQTNIDVEPGQTVALDDVLKSWFGTGTTSTLGTLEIRPLTQASSSTSSATVKGLSNFVTFASSRTFNVTGNGTFGQYIPAVPFANFVGGLSGAVRAPVLSLQQISQSAAYRTNLGFVEGSGNPVSLLVDVFGGHGEKLLTFPVDLAGGQHLQMSSVLAQKGVNVDDGRVEVSVASGTGKVTAYASVLDNRTNDPLLVTPVVIGEAKASKFVLPGVAQFTAGAGWQTDTRIFNAGQNSVKARLTFESLSGTAPKSADVDLGPGQVVQLDRTLESLFGVSNDGGAIHIATDSSANLIATARTYRPDAATGGTFGQFIQAVTASEAAGLGSRPLQILQVEESSRYRSNIGLAEVTGKPTSVEVTVVPPDSKFSATIQVDLAANQFTQISSLLQTMGLSDTHNARVTVKVINGDGRVAAYASVIDALTEDPTFVPAQ